MMGAVIAFSPRRPAAATPGAYGWLADEVRRAAIGAQLKGLLTESARPAVSSTEAELLKLLRRIDRRLAKLDKSLSA